MTTNMTAADVPELAVRVHYLMENALREISTHIEPLHDSITDASISPQLSPESGGVHEKTEDKQPVDGTPRSPSSASVRRRNSEAGSTAETESDEGMVLVGHPA
jgi:lysophosphatidate acyltransferase